MKMNLKMTWMMTKIWMIVNQQQKQTNKTQIMVMRMKTCLRVMLITLKMILMTINSHLMMIVTIQTTIKSQKSKVKRRINQRTMMMRTRLMSC
jgi:hypothetical protein